MWTWLPERLPADAPKANVVIFHGLGGHGRFPSVSIAAELLVSHGYKVSAVDFPGHGESPGLNGYIESADALIIDGINAAQAALRESYTGCPLFLLGSSMGGAIAVEVAAALAAMEIGVAGLVLLAPMLAPAAATPARLLLQTLAWTPLARLPLIPSSASDNSKQYADDEIRRRIDADELAYKGKLRIASAAAVLDLGQRVESNLELVKAPFFCLLAEREMVLGPRSRDAAERLMRVAATPMERRACKSYDALHGILCEPAATRDQIIADIVAWLETTANGTV